jgi:hypothetical protein
MICLYLMLPLSLVAYTLYQQPHPDLMQAGRVAHIVSVLCVFVAGVVFTRHRASKIAIALALPLTLIFSEISEDIRTVYLVILMYAFFLAGLALIQIDGRYVRVFVIAFACVSLPVMLLQFYGWPDWINALATHGLTGSHIGVGLQPTLGVEKADLKAILWQVRTAGLFPSNQMNTLFFFVLFAVTITLKPRASMFALPLAALYAVLTISKAAIVGSIILSLGLAAIYRGEHVKKAAVYLLWLAFSLAVFFLLFPGVMQSFFSPYVFLVSIFARLFDLLDSLSQSALIEIIVATSKEAPADSWQRAVTDTVKAFATSSGDTRHARVDYSTMGNLSLYSEIAREPFLSSIIIGLALATGVALNHRSRSWRFMPLQACLALGLGFYTVVAPVSSQQSFWVWVGMALPSIYGALVRVHTERGRESNASATLRSNSESMSGERSGGIS